ncbi:unnamed protein product [Cyclocybe aegerita]|uniref:Uncharacterized protein n=1 Tax=Cyclocybe aegerita TaxID=1973307 RepID=A0A8S0WQ79_CYCAE|nr:unnamed protein product [Cyclocybe aegerita]
MQLWQFTVRANAKSRHGGNGGTAKTASRVWETYGKGDRKWREKANLIYLQHLFTHDAKKEMPNLHRLASELYPATPMADLMIVIKYPTRGREKTATVGEETSQPVHERIRCGGSTFHCQRGVCYRSNKPVVRSTSPSRRPR